MQLSTAPFDILTMYNKIISCNSPSVSKLDSGKLWKFQSKHKALDLLPLHQLILLLGHFIHLISIEVHLLIHEHQSTLEHFLNKVIESTFDKYIQSKISERLITNLKINHDMIKQEIIKSIGNQSNTEKIKLYKACKKQDVNALLENIRNNKTEEKLLPMYYLFLITLSIKDDKKLINMSEILINLSSCEEFQTNPCLKGLLILCLIQQNFSISDAEIILKNLKVSGAGAHFMLFHYLELSLKHDNYNQALNFANTLKNRNFQKNELDILMNMPYLKQHNITNLNELISLLEEKIKEAIPQP